MPGAVYETALEITARGDFTSQIAGMLSKVDYLSDSVSKVGDGLGDMATGLGAIFTSVVDKAASLAMHMGKLAALGAAGGLAYGVASLNAGLEKTEISLAAIFNANGAVDGMGEGMKVGAEQMAKMRRDAADLPGEFSDLVGIFRAAAIPGLRAGLSVDHIRELSANTMAAGAASGLQMDMVAREMGMLLSGRAGAHNILGSQIFGLSGDAAKKFNESSAEQRVKTLEKQLSKFGEAKAVFGQSWEGITSTMVDNGKSVVGAVTKPLFESMKLTLDKANTWFSAHQTKIEGWSSYIGTRISDTFTKGQALLGAWLPTLTTFTEYFVSHFFGAWQRLEPIIERIAGHVGNMLKDPEGTLSKLTQVGGLYAGVKLATPVLGAGNAALGAAGVGGGMAGGALAIGAAGLALEVMAAFHVIEDGTAWLHDLAITMWGDIKVNVGDSIQHLSHAFEVMSPYIEKAESALGILFLGMLGFGTFVIEKLAAAIDWLSVLFVGLAKTLQEKFAPFAKLLGIDLDAKDPDAQNRKLIKGLADMPHDYLGKDGGANAAVKKAVEAPKGHVVNIKAEITISGQTDPSRVARVVVNHLSGMARNPKGSPFSPNYSGSR